MLAALGVFFVLAAALSLLGLCALAAHRVPPLLGTAAVLLTLAALAAAIPR